MLIPIRCFTCGHPVGDKWGYFVDAMIEKKNASKEKKDSQMDIQFIDIKDDGRDIDQEILNYLGILAQ